MTRHRLDAAPETVHWGFFDAALPPVLTVDSGDTIVVSTVSGGPEILPPAPFTIRPALKAVHAAVTPKAAGHICTGPIAVRGAKAGQVLEVAIEAIDLADDWGYNFVRPLAGALPDDFAERHLMHIGLDATRMTGRLPWGQEIPLAPFFGVMGTAPPAGWGLVNTLPPRRNGGNLDNKELVAGTTLFLPVHVDGALFSVGDGHGVQGDGEVCVTAIETGLVGTFRLTARPDMRLDWPMAETPKHLITMAFDASLDQAVVVALRNMLDLIVARTGLARHEAYALASLVVDLRVTQVVNGNKGIHAMIAKDRLVPRG